MYIREKFPVSKNYKPRVTCWNRKTVRAIIKLHKRSVRHAAKQYLKTGHWRDLKRAQKQITNWDFD